MWREQDARLAAAAQDYSPLRSGISVTETVPSPPRGLNTKPSRANTTGRDSVAKKMYVLTPGPGAIDDPVSSDARDATDPLSSALRRPTQRHDYNNWGDT